MPEPARPSAPLRRAAPPAEVESREAMSEVDNPPGDGAPSHGAPGGLDVGRIGWLLTVLTLLVGVLVLALKRDWGYATVTAVVALSAAINLF